VPITITYKATTNCKLMNRSIVSSVSCASLKLTKHDKIDSTRARKFDGMFHVPCSNLLSSHSSRMELHSVNALSISIIKLIPFLIDLTPKTVGRILQKFVSNNQELNFDILSSNKQGI
jgi:hypothetical protein